MIRTAVQHQDELIRSGLVRLLSQVPDIEVVGACTDDAALIRLCESARPDAVLLEADAERWDPARLAGRLQRRRVALRLVGVHAGLSSRAHQELVEAGVDHTVSYELGASSVISAVRGRTSNPPAVERTPSGTDILTSREREVLRLVARGLHTQEVATELDISIKTVENHKQRLFRKLGVQNQAHAVAVAIRQGLLGPRAVDA